MCVKGWGGGLKFAAVLMTNMRNCNDSAILPAENDTLLLSDRVDLSE